MRADIRRASPARLTAALAALAIALSLASVSHALPPRLWTTALLHPAAGDTAAILFHFASLPRAVTAFLCGAALALSGTVLQQVLDNPLAAPSTLGVSAGAELALVAATLWAPDTLGLLGRDAIATIGSVAAAAAVLLVAGRRLAPTRVILAGLVVGLFAAACGTALKLLDQEEVGALYLWGAGSLDGTDWSTVQALLPRLCLCALGTALLVRPLGLLSLAEGQARSLGVAVGPIRAAALGVAILLAASVTSAVGVIGFVEIAAPALARAAGARRFGARAIHASLIGGFLLVLVDAATRALSDKTGLTLPTGAATALLGAPLLLLFAARLREGLSGGDAETSPSTIFGGKRGPRLAMLGVAVVLVLVAALVVGRSGSGWSILGRGADLALVMDYRLPRSLAALGAGALLGAAGALLQRLTGNALVGPETLGLGAGAACGFAAALLLVATPNSAILLGAGAIGAGGVLAGLAVFSARGGFAPGRLLLVGVTLGAALQAGLGAVLALGDARSTQLLAWMAGSTYGVGLVGATVALGLAALLCPAAMLLGRLLDTLSLGPAVARALGVPLGPTRGLVALLAALMTAAAVMTVGPLTFVGLLGPQIAQRLGHRRGAAGIAGAALAGALVMAAADLLGRIVAAPFEIPAGLVAAVIGIPFVLALFGVARPRSIA